MAITPNNKFNYLKVKWSKRPLWLLALGLICTIHACKKTDRETFDPPTVELVETGLENSKTAYAGFDLHLDASITAPGIIDEVQLQITLTEPNYGWDFLQSYSESYRGRSEVNFHEHIPIPEDARPGNYTLLLAVTDSLGQKSFATERFELLKNPDLPRMESVSLEVTDPSVLTLKGNIYAPNKIAGVNLEIQSSGWTREFTFQDSDMLGKTEFIFEKDVAIAEAPAGHYHVHIIIIDQSGEETGYHYHFDKN